MNADITDQNIQEKKVLFKLGDVERMLGLPKTTILLWCRRFPEYLEPQRSKGGQRRFTISDIERLRRLNHLRNEKGISLYAIERILNPDKPKMVECENAKDAVQLLTNAVDLISDNPHAISMLKAVSRWISETHPVLTEPSLEPTSV